jgi:deoxyribodipyrimidine photo-lyase
MPKISLYVFSNDLRIADNPGLCEASSGSAQLLCIYCHSQASRLGLSRSPGRLSHVRRQFLRESLDNLRLNLKQFGQHLIEVRSSVEETIKQFVKQYGITHIYRSQNSGWFECQQWNVIAKQLPHVNFRACSSHTIFSECDLPFSLDNLPPTFSKFRREVEKLVISKPINPPSYLPGAPEGSEIWQDSEITGGTEGGSTDFVGGEDMGVCHLQQYFNSRHASSYKQTRNGLDGMYYSTKLSPWLANGSLSVKTVIARLQKYESDIGSNDSTYWILFELLWREYFHWYARRFREKVFTFGGINDNKPSTSYYPERFRKWCQGNTPFPLINAFMNQLNETGYMSNRGRQLVASCFVHELNLDWRYGASYMESHLIDYDVASNWGNWQYLAGVGADARGHRKFNIDKQASTYDPNGEFVRRWAKKDYLENLDSVDASDWPVE